ncbi:MAG: 50S ribosomal protein L1 [Chloroflexi bacterium]|nr:50S ribosomal protein L1 [Chloroflexota bacterium]
MTTRPALGKAHGKRYGEVTKLIDRSKTYAPAEAVELVKKLATAKFDETVELHIRTNADARHADQMLRGVVVLPHGTGKSKRVLVFAQGEAATAAKQAGADYVADDDIIRRIEQEGWVDFEVSIATPDMMGRIGRLGRVLGRRGLMPNPRTGTVVPPQDLPRTIAEAKGGRMEFRMDRTAIIHLSIGKASFSVEHLLGNLVAVVDTINRMKPEAVKGQFFRSLYLTSTMGPSIHLDLSGTMALKVE